jgi:hypothetical protein
VADFDYVYSTSKKTYTAPFVGLYAIGGGNDLTPLHITVFVDACAVGAHGSVNHSMCGAQTGFLDLPAYAVGGGFDSDNKGLAPTKPFTFTIGKGVCVAPTPTKTPTMRPTLKPVPPTRAPTAEDPKKASTTSTLGVMVGGLAFGLSLGFLAFYSFRRRVLEGEGTKMRKSQGRRKGRSGVDDSLVMHLEEEDEAVDYDWAEGYDDFNEDLNGAKLAPNLGLGDNGGEKCLE